MAFWKQSFPGRMRRTFPIFPDAIKKTMKLHFVESMDEVLKIALERELVALADAGRVLPGVRCSAGGRETWRIRSRSYDRSRGRGVDGWRR